MSETTSATMEAAQQSDLLDRSVVWAEGDTNNFDSLVGGSVVFKRENSEDFPRHEGNPNKVAEWMRQKVEAAFADPTQHEQLNSMSEDKRLVAKAIMDQYIGIQNRIALHSKDQSEFGKGSTDGQSRVLEELLSEQFGMENDAKFVKIFVDRATVPTTEAGGRGRAAAVLSGLRRRLRT